MIQPDEAGDDTIGGRISLCREHVGLSVEEAAQRLGVMPKSWLAWECDRDVPRGNRVTMMAGVLGVSPTWLLCGEGSGPIEVPAAVGLLDELKQVSGQVAALNKRLDHLTGMLEKHAPARNRP